MNLRMIEGRKKIFFLWIFKDIAERLLFFMTR